MKSLKIILYTLVFCLCVSNRLAHAAEDTSCAIVSEEIIPLRVPNFDTPILWKKTMGVPGPDRPVDLISLADGGFVVVGESATYDKDKGLAPLQLYMTRMDINGKILWEKRNNIPNFLNAAAGIAIKDRLAVLSEVAPTYKIKTARLDFYDGLGALKSTKIFSDPIYDLVAQGISPDAKSTSLVVALWAQNRKNPDDNFTILKQIAPDGKDIASRQYLPGLPNHLQTFKRTASGDFIGSGQIQTNGMTSGWVFYVDGQSGNLIFQRPYARGYQSNLRGITEDGQGNFIVVGDSVPTDAGLRAAWIMKIDSQGNPLWQRYVQGKYAFSARDVAVSKDGRILVMINARPSQNQGGGREHVRLLSFTPQGKLQGDEALIEGANAQGVDLRMRTQSRIIAGVTQAGLSDFPLAKNQKAAGYDFWIVALPKLSDFEDGCSSLKAHDAFDEGY